jgi:hypothetical protein
VVWPNNLTSLDAQSKEMYKNNYAMIASSLQSLYVQLGCSSGGACALTYREKIMLLASAHFPAAVSDLVCQVA